MSNFNALLNRADAVGITWYRRDDYKALLAAIPDRDVLPNTFDKWLSKAEAQERKFKALGKQVIRVYTDVENLTAYCAKVGLDIDAKGRVRFASDPANWPKSNMH